MEVREPAQETALADLYNGKSNLQYELGKRIYERELELQEGQAILDIGCGTGRLIPHLAERVGDHGRVVGVDPDGERISVARKAMTNRTNVSFIEGTTADAISAGPFDAAISSFALHWVPESQLSSTMQDIYDVLKPGGRLAALVTLSTGDIPNDISLSTTGRKEWDLLEWTCQPANFWAELGRSAGFEILRATNEPMNWPFDKVSEFFDFIKAYTNGHVDWRAMDSEDCAQLFSKNSIGSLNEPVELRGKQVEFVFLKPEV